MEWKSEFTDNILENKGYLNSFITIIVCVSNSFDGQDYSLIYIIYKAILYIDFQKSKVDANQ